MATEQDRIEILESFRREQPDLADALERAGDATVVSEAYAQSQKPSVSYWFGTDNRLDP